MSTFVLSEKASLISRIFADGPNQNLSVAQCVITTDNPFCEEKKD